MVDRGVRRSLQLAPGCQERGRTRDSPTQNLGVPCCRSESEERVLGELDQQYHYRQGAIQPARLAQTYSRTAGHPTYCEQLNYLRPTRKGRSPAGRNPGPVQR